MSAPKIMFDIYSVDYEKGFSTIYRTAFEEKKDNYIAMLRRKNKPFLVAKYQLVDEVVQESLFNNFDTEALYNAESVV